MNIQELRELMQLCKDMKVKHLVQDGISIEFSDLAFIESLTEEPRREMTFNSDKTFADDDKPSKEEEDEDLYWSSSR